jgi:hypothetical protein
MDHGVCVMLDIHWYFGVLHKYASCVNSAEQSLLAKGKYVNALLCDNLLLCTGGNGCLCGLWFAMWLDT